MFINCISQDYSKFLFNIPNSNSWTYISISSLFKLFQKVYFMPIFNMQELNLWPYIILRLVICFPTNPNCWNTLWLQHHQRHISSVHLAATRKNFKAGEQERRTISSLPLFSSKQCWTQSHLQMKSKKLKLITRPNSANLWWSVTKFWIDRQNLDVSLRFLFPRIHYFFVFRQELKDLCSQLHHAANYCEATFLNAKEKRASVFLNPKPFFS